MVYKLNIEDDEDIVCYTNDNQMVIAQSIEGNLDIIPKFRYCLKGVRSECDKQYPHLLQSGLLVLEVEAGVVVMNLSDKIVRISNGTVI